jgi:hypothetical protein
MNRDGDDFRLPWSGSLPSWRWRRRRRGREALPEARVLAGYSASLTEHAATLERIKGRKDLSAVDGYVGCAAIVGAILKATWRDEAKAMDLAARALVLSRAFLGEFLEASGGSAQAQDEAGLARRMRGVGHSAPRPDF